MASLWTRLSTPLALLAALLLLLNVMDLTSPPAASLRSSSNLDGLSELRRDLARSYDSESSYHSVGNATDTTASPVAPPSAAPTTIPVVPDTTVPVVPPSASPTTVSPVAPTSASSSPVPAPAPAAAPTTTVGPSTTTEDLCERCDRASITLPDPTCDRLLDISNLDCTSCGCSVTPGFFTSVSFYLIVVAAVLAVIGAIFVGVCLCRRSRATAVYKTTTTTTTVGSAEQSLLAGGHEDDAVQTSRSTTGATAVQGSGGAVEYARVRYNFTADSSYDEQISVSKNDRVQVMEKFDDGWWNIKHEATGRVGIVPASYCTLEASS